MQLFGFPTLLPHDAQGSCGFRVAWGFERQAHDVEFFLEQQVRLPVAVVHPWPPPLVGCRKSRLSVRARRRAGNRIGGIQVPLRALASTGGSRARQVMVGQTVPPYVFVSFAARWFLIVTFIWWFAVILLVGIVKLVFLLEVMASDCHQTCFFVCDDVSA